MPIDVMPTAKQVWNNTPEKTMYHIILEDSTEIEFHMQEQKLNGFEINRRMR